MPPSRERAHVELKQERLIQEQSNVKPKDSHCAALKIRQVREKTAQGTPAWAGGWGMGGEEECNGDPGHATWQSSPPTCLTLY